MNNPLSKDEQMRAMVSGDILQLIKEHFPSANEVTFGKYLTVSKGELISFLKKEPLLARNYANRNRFEAPLHDVYAISSTNDGYYVGWVDHSRFRDPIKVATLPEAVAEHMFMQIWT